MLYPKTNFRFFLYPMTNSVYWKRKAVIFSLKLNFYGWRKNGIYNLEMSFNGSILPELFLRKGILKICINFTGEHPCRNAISIKVLCLQLEITLRHACSPVNLLRIFRTPLSKNTSGWLLLFQIIGEHNAFIRFVKVPRYF